MHIQVKRGTSKRPFNSQSKRSPAKNVPKSFKHKEFLEDHSVSSNNSNSSSHNSGFNHHLKGNPIYSPGKNDTPRAIHIKRSRKKKNKDKFSFENAGGVRKGKGYDPNN